MRWSRLFNSQHYESFTIESSCWSCGESIPFKIRIPVLYYKNTTFTNAAKCERCQVEWKMILIMDRNGILSLMEEEHPR